MKKLIKRLKGFTLIELLAVIVILAIIALIATPIILGIINDSKKESIKSSAKLYVDGLSKKIASMNMTNEFNPSTCTVSNGDVTCDGQSIDYQVDGKKPTSGSITLDNGKITEYTLSFTDYTVTKDSNGIRVTAGGAPAVEFNGTYVAAGSSDTHKGIVYLDPTDLSATCTAEDAADNVNTYGTPTGIAEGCMKFYIYDDTGSNYKMILDHNTSGDVAWVTEEDFLIAGSQNDWNNYMWNTQGPLTANKRLQEDTAGWIGSPRLITADEVAHIVGADRQDTINWNSANSIPTYIYLDGGRNPNANSSCAGTIPYCENGGWQHQYANSSTPSNYSWLYDYTWGCTQFGCTVEDNHAYPYQTKDNTDTEIILGYWTSSQDKSLPSYAYAWAIVRGGELGSNDDGVISNFDFGVRPVITLSKSIFE